MNTEPACKGFPSTDHSVLGQCLARPCWCIQALVAGCTCGFYNDQIRRRAGHHSTECGIFQEAK